MGSNTRASLLERIRDATDPLAWDDFYDQYWPVVFTFAKYRGCSDETAQDVVQDVMLEIFKKHEVFRYDPAKGRFRNWLGGIVRNLVFKRRGKPSERVRAHGGESDPSLRESEDPHPEADEVWQQVFDEGLLCALLDVVRRQVAPSTYQAFELVALEGLSGADAAKVTGLSPNAVYKARANVLKRLQKLGRPYREEGRLLDCLKRALASRPPVQVERTLTTRMEETMRSRRELGT